ncbi:AI-2E family transporter [Pontiella sulfatireligans]|uniref:AI-2E family transporter n=1 Tax=Pontiella sulfatireligans TaxID=2750658 RepID=A0A6C2UTE8_9BACT|nr:AI-2E family transporter [Pontiella sulfatireligans]VGO23429.1 hypothetical protein SCARR_05536 [Pontiella sulfatireligans]
MSEENTMTEKMQSMVLMNTLIRFSLVAFLVFLCVRIFAPFTAIMTWGLMLAVMLYPVHQMLAKRMGGKQGRASTVLVVVGLLLVGGPMVTLGGSFVSHIKTAHAKLATEQLSIKPPAPSVEEWPVVGKPIYKAWNQASANFSGFLDTYKPELKTLSMRAFTFVKSSVSSVFLFLGALVVAGIIMAWGVPGTGAMRRIFIRLAGPVKGPQLQGLSVATVRSVVAGVLGVAFVQALLLGAGFYFAQVPAAGVLAVIVLLLGIMQLPAMVVSLPVIAYLWMGGDLSILLRIVFTLYILVAGMVDNVLKPMLLGRGVDVPMPVVLIGALGGMVVGGFIGLFLGAVLLAVGYEIFMDWVNSVEDVVPVAE